MNLPSFIPKSVTPQFKRPDLWSCLRLALVLLTPVLALAYHPAWLYDKPVAIGRFDIYDDTPQSPDLVPALAKTEDIIRSARLPLKGRIPVYFCSSRLRCLALLFAKVDLAGTFVPGRPGIAVSRQVTSRYSFPLPEILSHELAHLAVYQQVGYLKFISMPVWLQEGYAGFVSFALVPHKGLLTRGVMERDDYFQARAAVTMVMNKRALTFQELYQLGQDPDTWRSLREEAVNSVALANRHDFQSPSFAAHQYPSYLSGIYFLLARPFDYATPLLSDKKHKK